MAVINGRFKKGSSAGYAAIPVKDPNTFYYVDEEKLYLGEILLSEDESATMLAEAITLADKDNIFTSDNIEDAMVELAEMIGNNDVSVVEDATVNSVLKRYTFYKGEQIAANKLIDIDIPKDLMSVEGTIVSEDGEGNSGTFIKLDIGTSASDKVSSIYIDVASLVTGMKSSNIIYKDAVAADLENGIEGQEEVTVEDALDDLYDKIDNLNLVSNTFIWEEIEEPEKEPVTP